MEHVRLAEDRIEEFDNAATAQHTIDPVKEIIRRSIPRDNLVFVDVGGGNGTFLDNLLQDFPHAKGVNIDRSPLMCEKNQTNERKTVHCGDFMSWSEQRTKENSRVDVVFFNFVLHHFVSSTHAESVAAQQAALEVASKILCDDGLIVVYEINYNGWLVDDFPGKLIHWFTSSRRLSLFVKAMGANTAGYGVCFHSERSWKYFFSKAGLSILHQHQIVSGEFRGFKPIMHKLVLNIRSMDYKIYCLIKST